jgi:hypothetical protein
VPIKTGFFAALRMTGLSSYAARVTRGNLVDGSVNPVLHRGLLTLPNVIPAKAGVHVEFDYA